MSVFPKISVITPSYNQGKYIRETIESVLSQSYPDVEYIIIDGGSSDETLSIIDEYHDRIDCVVSEPDRGQSHAINKGFAKATGDIFCWLNSDDQYTPDALWSVALAFMHSGEDMVAGICEVHEDGALVHRHLTSCEDGLLPLADMLDLDNGWNAGQFFYQPEVFFTRALWQKAGGQVREDCFYSMDYELWCRFALNQARIQVIGVPLVRFRSHPEQKTANPEGFKAELVKVRNQFCEDNGIGLSPSARPPVDWHKKLKVAFVNDLGFLYGAGIAHMRLAGAFEMAGHQIKPFDFLSYGNPDSIAPLLADIQSFSPDIIVFGNLHGYASDHIKIVEELVKQFPCFWATHDFWMLTGRCAYFEGCSGYLQGCDQTCPTAMTYPILSPELISIAYDRKRAVIQGSDNLHFWANSEWSSQVVERYLDSGSYKNTVHRIHLGTPSDRFRPLDKSDCRKKLGIATERFVIVFSVSSLSDTRKGGGLLFKALQSLDASNVTLLLIGRMDQTIDLPGIELISLGYVKDTSDMVMALNAADIYVGPSREETFGQVFVEAALCGVPSVGFAGSGVESAIVEGVTGRLVSEINPEALTRVICDLKENEDERYRLGKTACLHARNHFSLEKSYHSLFCSLNRLGLVDYLGLPHKISLAAQSRLVYSATRSLSDMEWSERINYMSSKFINRLLDRLPRHFRSGLAGFLPAKVKSAILKWILRNPYL